MLPAVLHTVRAFDLDVGDFERFLDSMAMDLHTDGYRTYDDLLGYMEGSAAVIGTMMAPILESADPPAAREHARQLGLAFQLTNFIRDVAEDLRRGRVYLPAGRPGALRGAPGRPGRPAEATPAVAELLAFEVERARAHYRAAEPGIELLAPSSRPCIRVAFELYGGILDEVERAGYQVLDRRVRGPPPPPPGRRRPPLASPPAPPPAPNAASASPPPAPDEAVLGVATALALVVAVADGFLLWARGLATPVGAEGAAASYLAGQGGPAGGPPAGPAAAGRGLPLPDQRVRADRPVRGRAGLPGGDGPGGHLAGRLPLARDRAHLHPARGDLRLLRHRRRRRRLRLLDQPDLLPGAGRPAVRLRPGRPAPAHRPPPRATPGAGAASRAPRSSANTTVYVGPETVQTAAGPVATRHVRLLTALSGQSSGGAVRDLWLDRDGLVVKEDREVSLKVRSVFVGLLTYDERASFLLAGRP